MTRFHNEMHDLGYRPGPRPRPWNILLVVVDDLRADHLPAYGYSRRTTPRLDRRLEDAVVFTNCHSPVGWTLPACASIITGQHPDDHGLYDHNQKFRKPKLGHYLGDQYFRLGLTNNGNVVSDTIPREYLESLGLKRRPAKWRFFHWDDGFDRYVWTARENHRRPYDLAETFLDGLPDASGGKPWFLFLHSNVVHDYHMDRDYYLDVKEWIDEEIHPGLLSVRDGPEIWKDPPDGVTQEMITRQMVAKYDAGIRHMDRWLDAILDRVDFESTIVVFMSDHGEGFEPDVGRVHHCGRWHRDLSHVPLALWLPEPLRQRYDPPRREDRPSSTVDVVPTLLTLLGDVVAGLPGRFLFDLSTHRRLTGSDRGYIYWGEDCVRESYDTCRIEIRGEVTYPIKEIVARRNDGVRRFAYNLAYDPGERDNLLAPGPRPIPNFEPITFVVAVNDEEELAVNLLASPVAGSPHHRWMLVENPGNCRYRSISELYQEALDDAPTDLVYFIHQDVLLPHGWERQMFSQLRELEKIDPDWGVVGAVGALPPQPGQRKQLRGHWCDPSGYHQLGPLPVEVQSLDEQWLGVRKSSGIHFDPELPGFHCYGIDLSLMARSVGRRTYAIDSFVWHKFCDSRGHLVSRREDSDKIVRRWGDEFMSEFLPSAEYVEQKWKEFLPFQTTSWSWGVA